MQHLRLAEDMHMRRWVRVRKRPVLTGTRTSARAAETGNCMQQCHRSEDHSARAAAGSQAVRRQAAARGAPACRRA